MLILRDMQESDIEDYVTWFTTETEYYESVKNLPDEVVRWKFEIV